MNAYIFALGRIHSKKAVPAILARGQELSAAGAGGAPAKAPDFARCRILSLACESICDPALADLLAQLLDLPGVTGHAIPMSTLSEKIPPVPGYDSRSNYSHDEKRKTLREINLARALYRLGDKNAKAAAILKAYADDPRGFYAHYARMLLAEKPATR